MGISVGKQPALCCSRILEGKSETGKITGLNFWQVLKDCMLKFFSEYLIKSSRGHGPAQDRPVAIRVLIRQSAEAAFLDPGGLAPEFAQIIDFGAAYPAPGNHFNGIDNG